MIAEEWGLISNLYYELFCIYRIEKIISEYAYTFHLATQLFTFAKLLKVFFSEVS